MKKLEVLQKIFKQVEGQKLPIEILTSAILNQKIAPGYLFLGPHGVGRKLTAKCFIEGILTFHSSGKNISKKIEALNHPDLIWIEPTYTNAGNLINKSLAEKENINPKAPAKIRLEQIRDVTKFLNKKPIESELSLVVIESAETMTEASANALLKTLEEPLNGVLILIAERPEQLLPTICSRCQAIPFLQLNSEAFNKVFAMKNDSEGINLDINNGMKEIELTNLAGGSPGAFIEHLKYWQKIPQEIIIQLKDLSSHDSIAILSLAKSITEELDIDSQIWLINWFQQNIWITKKHIMTLGRLEKLRSQILTFVQPRLAWEIALIEIKQLSA